MIDKRDKIYFYERGLASKVKDKVVEKKTGSKNDDIFMIKELWKNALGKLGEVGDDVEKRYNKEYLTEQKPETNDGEKDQIKESNEKTVKPPR